MNVKLIGKHEKDSRACRDGLALTLDEMMAQDKSICYVDCDLMGCINTKRLREHYPDRAFEAGIAEGNAAAMEFRVDEHTHHRGVPLKDVPLRRGVLISCISRGADTIIPDGTSSFEVGDTVVAVSTLDAPVMQLNDLFV